MTEPKSYKDLLLKCVICHREYRLEELSPDDICSFCLKNQPETNSEERYTLDSILQEKRTLRGRLRYFYLRFCVFTARIEWSEVGYFIACVLLMALFFYLYGKRVEQ